MAPEVAVRYFAPLLAAPAPLTCPGRRAALSDHESSGRGAPARFQCAAGRTDRMRSALAIAAAGLLLSAGIGAAPDRSSECRPPASAPTRPCPPGSTRPSAVEIVSFMDQYWRLAGQSRVQRLDRSHPRPAARRGIQRRRRMPAARPGRRIRERGARLELPGRHGHLRRREPGGEPLLSRDRDRVSLAINSFSDADGGLRARLMDVGPARAQPTTKGRTLPERSCSTDAPLGRALAGGSQEARRRRRDLDRDRALRSTRRIRRS